MDVELREWNRTDAASLAESANDSRIATWLNEGFPYPYTLQDAEKFIEQVLSDDLSIQRAIVAEGKVVGGIGAGRKRGALRYCAELGYWLSPSLWNGGVMTAAVRAFCGEVFETTQISRLQAMVFAPNAASCRVLEKCGFEREGVLRQCVRKDGRCYDAVLYGLLAPKKEKV